LLGWAGLRGAVPIVLATYPQAAGLPQSATIFNAVFFVVLASALIQGPTLEPFARRLHLTGRRGTYEPPLEVAAVDSLGSGLLEFGVDDDSAVAGRYVRELGLPRDALVAVLVRGVDDLADGLTDHADELKPHTRLAEERFDLAPMLLPHRLVRSRVGLAGVVDRIRHQPERPAGVDRRRRDHADHHHLPAESGGELGRTRERALGGAGAVVTDQDRLHEHFL